MSRTIRSIKLGNAIQATAISTACAAILLAGCGTDTNNSNKQADTVASASDSNHGNHSDDGAHTDNADRLSPHTTKLEFSSNPASIPVGKAATWRLRIVDASTGEPVQEFDSSHDKLMHLVVVSKDLSWFHHIHPEYKGDGVFTITTAIPTSGSYKLYADYTPKGKAQEVSQHEFATDGAQATSATTLPLVDTVGEDGWMVKEVGSSLEGSPDNEQGSYQVALMPMPAPLKAGQEVMLHFQVRDGSGKPITNLQPYLGAMGHAVILSADTKMYLHAHPMDHDENGGMDHESGAKQPASDVIFHTTFPSAGIYKVWGQFQHNGRIITAPFVLNVEAAG